MFRYFHLSFSRFSFDKLVPKAPKLAPPKGIRPYTPSVQRDEQETHAKKEVTSRERTNSNRTEKEAKE